jgi:hypothetical protein
MDHSQEHWSNRWSLGNLSLPISWRQFTDLTTQFKVVAEEAFGTTCKLDVRLLSRPEVYITFYDRDIQDDLDARNDAATFLNTDNLRAVTKELWEKAGYADVVIKPIDESRAPINAFASVEFKGTQPRWAAFYIQCALIDAKRAMLKNNRFKLVRDGFSSNGINSGRFPASVAGLFRGMDSGFRF